MSKKQALSKEELKKSMAVHQEQGISQQGLKVQEKKCGKLL